jgi:hypothetical protein
MVNTTIPPSDSYKWIVPGAVPNPAGFDWDGTSNTTISVVGLVGEYQPFTPGTFLLEFHIENLRS